MAPKKDDGKPRVKRPSKHAVSGKDHRMREHGCPCKTLSFWANDDECLTAFRKNGVLAKMNAAFYIDVDTLALELKDLDDKFDVASHPAALANYHLVEVPYDPRDKDRNPDAMDIDDEIRNDPIHPVFRREQWDRIDDDDWSWIESAARLATHILEEPAILPFFNGFVNGVKPLTDPQAITKCGPNLRHFNSLSFAGEKAKEEQMALWVKLAELKNCVRWNYGATPEDVYAATTPDTSVDGLGPEGETYGSNIKITHDHTFVFFGRAPLKKFQDCKRKQWAFDVDSARRRTLFHLAIIMVHELCHALDWAITSRPNIDLNVAPKVDLENSIPEEGTGATKETTPENHNSKGDMSEAKDPHAETEEKEKKERKLDPPDAFYSDHRIAELGNAFEQVVFGGNIDPLGGYIAAPYGLKIIQFPGSRRTTIPKPGKAPSYERERGSPIKFGCTSWPVYPVNMMYVNKLFTKDFWEREVVERQLDAFVPDKDPELVCWQYKNQFDPTETQKILSLGTDGIARETDIDYKTILSAGGAQEDSDSDSDSDSDADVPDAAPEGSIPAGTEVEAEDEENDEEGDNDVESATTAKPTGYCLLPPFTPLRTRPSPPYAAEPPRSTWHVPDGSVGPPYPTEGSPEAVVPDYSPLSTRNSPTAIGLSANLTAGGGLSPFKAANAIPLFTTPSTPSPPRYIKDRKRKTPPESGTPRPPKC